MIKFWPPPKHIFMISLVGLVAALFSIASVQSAPLYPIISMFDNQNGAPLGQGTVGMHQGYLFVPSGRDAGAPGGGFSFYDISNPARPTLMSQTFNESTYPLREIHTFGVSDNVFAMQSTEGVMFWDMSDVAAPKFIHHMDLPDIQESDYGGAWWLHWQAPYLYIATIGGGLYIVNAENPAQPTLVNRLLPGDLGMAPRAAFALGNLLVLAQDKRVATFDISDPAEPVRLDKLETDLAYSWMLNGHLMLGAGISQQLIVVDLKDPANLTQLSDKNILGGRGGYISVQDDIAHVGASEQYIKIDISDPTNPTVMGTGSSGISGRDEDFATALGNLVFVGNDHENGSTIIRHSDFDRSPPTIAAIHPSNNATHIAITSRIGLSMSDLIDTRTLTAENVLLRPVLDNDQYGESVPGQLSHQFGIINFAPLNRLQPNQTYEIRLAAGGLRDVAGNTLSADFKSRFSTGAEVSLSTPPSEPPEILSASAEGSQPFLLGNSVSFSVEGMGDGELEYFWDFSDRSTPADWSADNEQVSHTFDNAGNYSVLVRVRDSHGQTAAAILGVSVAPPIPDQLPVSSGPMALDNQRRQLWVVNPDNDTLAILDANSLELIRERSTCKRPSSVALDRFDQAWVTCRDADHLLIFDASNGDLIQIKKLRYGSQPVSIIFDPEGEIGYVAEYGTGRVGQIDAETGTIDRYQSVGDHPQALAVSGNGATLLVSRFISTEDSAVVWKIDTAEFGDDLASIELPIDTQTVDDDKAARGLPNYLTGIAIHPTEPQAWVVGKKDNILRGGFRDGRPLTFETSVRAMLSSIDLNTATENRTGRIDINNHAQPSAAAYSPYGNHLFVTMQGNNRLLVLDAASGNEIGRANTGRAPQGVLVDAATGQIYTKDFLGRTVTVFDGLDLLISGTGALKQVKQVSTVSEEKLTDEVLLGKRLFYDAADPRLAGDGYMSCASCHLDGGHDGRTWDMTHLGEGVRNTSDLRGHDIGTDMLHWTGNFDEVQDFEMQIRELAGGSGLVDDDLLFDDKFNRTWPLGDQKAGLSSDLDALATYVKSLSSAGRSPYRNPDGSLTELGIEGRVVFENAGCAACHGGQSFNASRDTARFDVGTQSAGSGKRLGSRLDGFDPPTLRGLWHTAPYLHDGSAADLATVLSNTTHVGELSADDKNALEAYLLQIDDLAGPDGSLTIIDSGNLFLPIVGR